MEAEARSIANRPDLNDHISKLRQGAVISEFIEAGARDFTK